MRIHTDALTSTDIHQAALIARVDYAEGGFTIHGSRTRSRAFNVTLTGESRRRPNRGTSRDRYNPDYAATWDQWGVFLAVLFDRDPDMVTPYYADRDDFNYKTDARFTKIGGGWDDFWPADAHGDHSWEYRAPRVRGCRRCSAVQRFGGHS
jgi:hypothetical protein